MTLYPKRILSIPEQLQSYIDGGMIIDSTDRALVALDSIGYYRLRGYCYHLYDNATKQYQSGTKFDDVLSLYRFDSELSHLIFAALTEIEVALRSRLSDSLLVYGDALVLFDPTKFNEKTKYWNNLGALSSEIARSNDVFVQHNFDHHDGQMPLWAAVEVMTFGNLSKTIKNLKNDTTGASSKLRSHYIFISQSGNEAVPSAKMFTSWIQAVSVLRNVCAHNSRIYNRTFNTIPELLNSDQIRPVPRMVGLYHILLAIKYLRPSDEAWTSFVGNINVTFAKYAGVIDYSKLGFPADWTTHFVL